MNLLAVLAGSEHQVCQFVSQDCLLLLVLVERVEQRQRFVAFLAERTHGFSAHGVKGRLRSREGRCEDALASIDGDVQGQMMAAELEQPRRLLRGRAKERDVIKIPAEKVAAGTAGSTAWRPIRAIRRRTGRRPTVCAWRAVAAIAWGRPGIGLPVDLVAFHDLLDLLIASLAKSHGEQVHRSGALRGRHLLEAHTAARDEAGGQVRPSRSLLLIVEGIQDTVTLLRIETGNEAGRS